MNFPLVSILIAARNEEDNILDLLHSLDKLTYPKESLQILVGNDGSTDRTEEIIRTFISQKKQYQLFTIEKQIAGLKGKTNVLAQLAHYATGEYFFFTDADVEVPTRWIEEMMALNTSPQVGVITGITLVKNNNWFEACQAIEWFFALYVMKKMADFKYPSTGMGNNMMVSVEAYRTVGGYEKIGFSIIEDYALYKAIVDKGYEFKQAYTPSLMTITKPPKSYFEQRKRWVAGGISSGSVLIVPALIQGFAFLFLLILGFFSWEIVLLILSVNLLVNFFYGFKLFKKVNQLQLLKYIPAYTLYMYIFWFFQLVGYLLPTKLVWKGRSY